jgi:hypothetical protein
MNPSKLRTAEIKLRIPAATVTAAAAPYIKQQQLHELLQFVQCGNYFRSKMKGKTF